MLYLYSGRHRAYRRLRRRAASFLLFATWPGLVFAQDKGPAAPPVPVAAAAPGAPVAAADPAQQPAQPITEASSRGIFSEPGFIAHGVNFAVDLVGNGTGGDKNGFYPEFSNQATGAGFISVGPGYRHTLFDGNAFVDTSAALSWHLYKMAQARLEFPSLADDHLRVGAQTMYQDNTQVNYFGLGDIALVDEQTQYRLRSTQVGGYAVGTWAEWFSLGAEVGGVLDPKVTPPAGTFNPDFPFAGVVFPNDPAMNLSDQPDFIRSELSVMADTIDAHSHPTRGSLYRGAVTNYSDQDGSNFDFTLFEAEGLQIIPLVGDSVLLGLHGWTVHADPGSGSQVPFYLMPSIGGNNTLRAFHSFQFHDLNTLVGNAEVRFAVTEHVDLATFFDAGNVAAKYSDLNFDRTSVGAGVRLHTQRATFARLDVAHGSQGWNVVVRTTDPFRFSRVTRTLAVIPFAP